MNNTARFSVYGGHYFFTQDTVCYANYAAACAAFEAAQRADHYAILRGPNGDTVRATSVERGY